MSKMGSHSPFGYLKHKLWPKEGLIVKLWIQLSSIKSQESPSFICVYVACHIPLKTFWWGLQLCLRYHLNWMYAHEIMSLQSCKSPNFRNFETPNLGVPGQNDIWVQVPWPGTENNIRGKVVASPMSKLWWVLWDHVCSWLVSASKVFQLTLTNLLCGLCRSCE